MMATTLRPGSHAQRGLTLVELMVGLAIGLMLVSGLSLMFGNSSSSANELDKSVRQIENGRIGIDLLAEEMSMAGFFAEATTYTGAATGSPCQTSANAVVELDALRAMSPATVPFGMQGLAASEAAVLPCLANHLAGTPAVVVRRLDTNAVAAAAITPGLAYMQSSNHADEPTATYLAGTASAAFVLRDMDGTINKVRRYISRVYYIASCNECGADTVPTLKRAELRGDQIVISPIAEGIQQIGVDYGFDSTGDGIPDSWLGLNGAAGAPEIAAATALGWGNVVAARLHLLARTSQGSSGFVDSRVYALGLRGNADFTAGPFNDSFKRRLYTTTARLNSIAGPRE